MTRFASVGRHGLTGAIALAIFAFTWLFRFNDPGGSFAYLTDDHFFYLVRGWQILFGELPVRDFVDHGAPLYYYLGAAVQLLFGRGTLSEVVFSTTMLAVCAAGVFLLAANAAGSRLLGLWAAAWHILLEPRYYNYPKLLVYILAIPALWRFADRPTYRRAGIVAVIAAIGFLFRHDHGAFVAVAFGALVLFVRQVSFAMRLRYVAVFGLVLVLVLTPYLLFIQANGGIDTYFSAALAWAERDRDRAEVVFPGLFDNPDGVSEQSAPGGLSGAIASVRDNSVAWTFYGEIALPFVALAVLALFPHAFRSDWPNAPAKIAVVATLGILLNAGFLRAPLGARLADPSVPLAILMAWLVATLFRMFRRPSVAPNGLTRAIAPQLARLGAVALTIPVALVLWITATKDWHDRLDKASMVDRPGRAFERAGYMWGTIGRAFPIADQMPEADKETVMALAYYVRQCTQPGDFIFMQHYLPQITALGERPFAGGHADLRPGFFTSDEMQNLTLSRLQRQRPPVVFLGRGESLGGFRDSFPVLAQYFDEHYSVADEREVDGRFDIRLLVRSDLKPSGTFEPLGWPCFR